MTIMLKKDAYNRIIAACKDHTCKSSARLGLTQIKVEYDAPTQSLTAIALDGYTMSTIRVDATGEESCEFLMPPLSPTKAVAVTISVEEGRITVEHLGGMQETYPHALAEFIDWKRVLPETQHVFRIAVNPKYLERIGKTMALEGYTSVVLTFYDPTSPIKIEGNTTNQLCLLLPVKRDDI